MKLQTGMHIVVNNNPKEYQFSAGKTKLITAILPNFGSKRAYELDGDGGIWCEEDFYKCVEYPEIEMED